MSDAKATVTTSLRGKGKLTAVGMKKWFQYNRNAIIKNATETSKRPEKQSGVSITTVCRRPRTLTSPTVILSGASTCKLQQRELNQNRSGRKANMASIFPEMPLTFGSTL